MSTGGSAGRNGGDPFVAGSYGASGNFAVKSTDGVTRFAVAFVVRITP
ncbi:hypothetical protein [Streptomyces sp. NRRL F-5123]|nr:hypothetical protein [Streptomyces sp. NRRL F-5123]